MIQQLNSNHGFNQNSLPNVMRTRKHRKLDPEADSAFDNWLSRSLQHQVTSRDTVQILVFMTGVLTND